MLVCIGEIAWILFDQEDTEEELYASGDVLHE
jgi:hypothetical protein